MPDLTDSTGMDIPLSQMIESLRLELAVAASAGKDSGIQFDVESVDLELRIALARAAGGGKITFGVLSANAKVAAPDLVHTFKLKLRPVPASAPKGPETTRINDVE